MTTASASKRDLVSEMNVHGDSSPAGWSEGDIEQENNKATLKGQCRWVLEPKVLMDILETRKQKSQRRRKLNTMNIHQGPVVPTFKEPAGTFHCCPSHVFSEAAGPHRCPWSREFSFSRERTLLLCRFFGARTQASGTHWQERRHSGWGVCF